MASFLSSGYVFAQEVPLDGEWTMVWNRMECMTKECRGMNLPFVPPAHSVVMITRDCGKEVVIGGMMNQGPHFPGSGKDGVPPLRRQRIPGTPDWSPEYRASFEDVEFKLVAPRDTWIIGYFGSNSTARMHFTASWNSPEYGPMPPPKGTAKIFPEKPGGGTNQPYPVVSRRLGLSPVKLQQFGVILTDFEVNKSDLLENHKKVLDKAAHLFKDTADDWELVDVSEIQGRASQTGPEANNKALSKKRADAVASYLDGVLQKGDWGRTFFEKTSHWDCDYHTPGELNSFLPTQEEICSGNSLDQRKKIALGGLKCEQGPHRVFNQGRFVTKGMGSKDPITRFPGAEDKELPCNRSAAFFFWMAQPAKPEMYSENDAKSWLRDWLKSAADLPENEWEIERCKSRAKYVMARKWLEMTKKDHYEPSLSRCAQNAVSKLLNDDPCAKTALKTAFDYADKCGLKGITDSAGGTGIEARRREKELKQTDVYHRYTFYDTPQTEKYREEAKAEDRGLFGGKEAHCKLPDRSSVIPSD